MTGAQRLRRALRAAVDWLYPPVCALCYAPLAPGDAVVCFRCERAMTPAFDWECDRCGAGGFGAGPEPGRACRLCPPAGATWQGVWAAAPYAGPAGACVRRFKYRRRAEMGELMARLMVQRLRDRVAELGARLTVVVPVPLHWTRRWTRGFNQSDLLARRLAEATGLPRAPRLLRRVRYTRRQALVPRERRAANVAGAFAVARGADLRGQGVLLVDDVVTTGHTIGECARVLREAGAREVWVACFARAGLGAPDEQEWLVAT